MSAARQKGRPPAGPVGLGRLIRLVRGPASPLVWIALLVALLAGTWYLVWRRVGEQVLSAEQYLIGPEQLEITPLPEWIHTDIRFEVFRNASLDGPLSIMDEKLVERIDNAFSLNPWVAQVVRVSKHASARVKVELVYRRPVCMVEVPGDLLPVDAHGVLLPYGNDDFSPVEKSRYPLLVGITSARVAVGECWGDPRVVGGAEIAAAVREVWEELQLQRIQPSDPFDTGVAEEPTYKLFSRGGAVIFWGRAPGTKVPGELPAAEKVARLLEYVRLRGPLKTASGAQMLDVHKLPDSPGPRQ